MSSAGFDAKRNRRQAFFLPRSRRSAACYITLIADVAQSYFTLRELDLELEIGRRTLKINDDTVEFYQRRLFGGVSNQLEAGPGGRQPLAYRLDYSRAGAPDRDRKKISSISSRPQSRTDSSGHGFNGSVLSAQAFLLELPAALLERRPDVKGAEDLLLATNADIGAAKALFFPKFFTDFGSRRYEP